MDHGAWTCSGGLLRPCWLWLVLNLLLPGRAGIRIQVDGVDKRGLWSWVILEAWAPALLASGELPQLYFPRGTVVMPGPSPRVDWERHQEQEQYCRVLCGAGPYKLSLSPYVNVISIPSQAPKLWAVAVAGQWLMAALRRGRAACSVLSHSGAERGGCGRVLKKLRHTVAGQRCAQTELAPRPDLSLTHPLSLADTGSVLDLVLVNPLL